VRKAIDYYFALPSPWTYLGGERLIAIARRAGATIAYKPIDVGRVFQAAGTLHLKDRPKARQAYRLVELRRWRDKLGMPINLQPKFFPVDQRLGACMVVAARQAGHDPGPLANALMRAIWVEDKNIADPAVCEAIAEGLGYVGPTLRTAAEGVEVQAEFDANSDEAIRRQVFGLPWYVFKDEPFWGQDRLEFLDAAVRAG
jgi:2-hydroxychromene-2-carboxylate isomerase